MGFFQLNIVLHTLFIMLSWVQLTQLMEPMSIFHATTDICSLILNGALSLHARLTNLGPYTLSVWVSPAWKCPLFMCIKSPSITYMNISLPAIDCGKPVIPIMDPLTDWPKYNDTRFGDQALYQCLDGYWYYRDTWSLILTCTAGGTWGEGYIPKCQGIVLFHCFWIWHLIAYPQHIQVFDDVMNFSPVSEVSCPAIGTWDGKSVDSTGILPGATALCVCGENTTFEDGANNISVTCLENGHWSSDVPECISRSKIHMTFNYLAFPNHWAQISHSLNTCIQLRWLYPELRWRLHHHVCFVISTAAKPEPFIPVPTEAEDADVYGTVAMVFIAVFVTCVILSDVPTYIVNFKIMRQNCSSK